jgi:hypothetical protein
MNHSFRFIKRPLLLNRMGSSSDPFNNPNNTNIFDQAARGQERDQSRMPPQGATDYVPSNVVPGQRVEGTPSTGPNGQLGHRVDNSAQSPLASYMGDDYHMYSVQDSGQKDGQDANGQGKGADKPKGAFDAELSEFEGVVANHNFIRPEDQELGKKALAGDVSAMMELMNGVARRAASSSAYISTKVSQNGVASELEAYGKRLPDQLNEREFSNLFAGQREGVLANPKIDPLIPAAMEKFRKEFPKAPPAKIKQAVIKYLEDVTNYSSQQPTSAKSGKGESEWDSFFDNM